MVPASGPHDDDSWPQLPPGRALPSTPRPSNKPSQPGLVSTSNNITVAPRDLSWNNNESVDVGSRRATSRPMSGERHSYSDILRIAPPREHMEGAPDARPAAVSGQQLRTRSPRPTERRTTAVPAAQSSSHQTVARRDSRDGQVRVHTVVVLAFTGNAPPGSLPLVKPAGKAMLRSPYHPPIHPAHLLGKTFHLGHETYRLRENHKIRGAMRPLIFEQPKDKWERSTLWSLRLTLLAPIKLTPPLPSSRLLNPLPILRHFRTNWASQCLRHHRTRRRP